MNRAWLSSAAALLVALALAACDGRNEVVVYTSADEQVARPVFERFERETGIAVVPKFDTEATKTTGLANVLRAEATRPRADVFWSNEQAAVVALGEEGVLAPNSQPEVMAWPERWRAADGRWASFAGRARVVVYDPERVKDPPERWTDLLDPRWKKRVAMADPRFGTTRGHLGAMKAYWDAQAMPGYYEAWALGLAENEPLVLTSGNAGVVDAVARGEADIGLTDTDDVLAAQARGLRVAMVQPRHARSPKREGGGTYLVPNTVGLVKGAPHPDAAARFIAFMLASGTEAQLAAMPAKHAPVVHPAQPGDLTVPDPLLVDPAQASAAATAAVESFMQSRDEVAKGGASGSAPRAPVEPVE